MRNSNQRLDTSISNATDNEQIIIQSQNTTFWQFICGFIKLYSYAENAQKVAIFIGIFVGICLGIAHPLFLYLWFDQLNLAIMNQGDLTPYLGVFRTYLFYFIALGFTFMLLNGILFAIWKYISRSISKKIRIRYLQQFIKQSLTNVEKRNSYQWSNDFKIHTLNIQKSIGDKVALLLNLIGIVVSGVTSAMIMRWTFSLYMLILTPIIILILSYFIYVQVQKKKINIESGKQAQDKALQATSMIKTVKMLNGQQKEALDYQQKLGKGEQKLKQYNYKVGLSTGLFFCMQYLFFGAGFLMGIQCVKGGESCPVSVTGSRYAINEFLSVFFQIFFCTYNFLQLGSNYTLIKSAVQSSKKIFAFIEETRVERQLFENQYPNTFKRIFFRNIDFSYPLHPQHRILSNFNLSFEPFKFNAIVGTTGSGKSTIIQLLLKQYDPDQGQILVDQTQLRRIRTSHWLAQIGVVTQQPVLFDGTIRQNVKVGKQDASDEEIINALTQANIYDFVTKQSEGLNFQIGVGGSKLSGGQKQRIAIARALAKKPKLLILDEATSALDPATQQQIQSALQDIRKAAQNNITIICIAHRIRTIRNADIIFLLKNGSVAQSGKFQQLQYFKDLLQNDRQQNSLILPPLKRQSSRNKIRIRKLKPYNQRRPQQNLIEVHQQEKDQQSQKLSIYQKLLKYTNNYRQYLLCLFLAIIVGCIHLTSSILIAYHVDQLNRFFLLGKNTNWCEDYDSVCQNQLDQYFSTSQNYLYGLMGLAAFAFLPYFFQASLLSKIENQIAFNLKKKLFRKILGFQVKFFEIQENESGGAASKFGNDCRDSSTLVTSYIPILICNFCIAFGAVIICFLYDWRFGLLSLIVTPLISLSFYISMLFIGGYQDSSLQKLNKSDQTANQLITTFKTVLVLDYQKRFLQKYKKQVNQPFFETLKVGSKIGLFYGFAFFILDVVVGMSLYFSVLILSANPQIKPISIIIYMIVSTFSGFIIGNNFYFIAHISASKEAGARVMEMLNTQSEVEIQKKMRRQLVRIDEDNIDGKIQFRNISFKYKNDDSKLILNNVSLTINPGNKVAFIGQSGCGKSTLLQLLLRFYQFQGEILVDGVNIFDYDLKQYRNIFSMLNQQPSLFAGTIEQNIKYNSPVKKQRLRQICEKSCAYKLNFDQTIQSSIMQFTQRKVGPKGSNISGGEKQRIACARALARNSKIFLMDQGTSALDRGTEIDLQRGVSEQFSGRTMITVAHRIQTIDDSDEVFVFNNGEIVQFGNPSKLLQKKGHFYNFANGNKIQP